MSWSQTKIDVRAKKRDEAVIFLTENNIPFSSYNYGAHLRIGRIDFWNYLLIMEKEDMG